MDGVLSRSFGARDGVRLGGMEWGTERCGKSTQKHRLPGIVTA